MCPWGIQVKVPEVNWDYQSRAGERHLDWNARFEGHHPARRGLIYTSGLSSEALTQIECNIGPSGKKTPKPLLALGGSSSKSCLITVGFMVIQ